jgi:hypothetical protein
VENLSIQDINMHRKPSDRQAWRPLLAILALALAGCDRTGKQKNAETGVKNDSAQPGNEQAHEVSEPSLTRQEQLAGELMASTQEVFECVLEVSDTESAKVAERHLGKIESQLKRTYEELRTLNPAPAEVRAGIRKKMDENDKVMWSLQNKVNAVIGSLRSEDSKRITDAIMRCSKVIQAHHDDFKKHFLSDDQKPTE